MPLTQQTRFLASKKLYAINPASFQVTPHPAQAGVAPGWAYSLDAVWFTRRANGRRAATIGKLWDHSGGHRLPAPSSGGAWNLAEFMQWINTAQYGGTPLGSWDGNGTWWAKDYADDIAKQQAVLPMLQQMLAAYPAAPSPYEGWYLLEYRRHS